MRAELHLAENICLKRFERYTITFMRRITLTLVNQKKTCLFILNQDVNTYINRFIKLYELKILKFFLVTLINFFG